MIVPPRRLALLAIASASLALGGCASAERHPASLSAQAAAFAAKPVWAFESSDVPLDPAFHCGRLANGLRYIIVPNATPKGVSLVRMQVEAGSLDEADSERGLAHFVEHMAFEGSTHVPEGGMVPLLERLGLAFGADTNASTGYENTTYALDLPKNDPALLDTALMLMRETATELSFAPDAVMRERGVVLAEKRDRNSWQFRSTLEQQAFMDGAARYTARMPIGDETVIEQATPQVLRGFWSREYIPSKTVVVVIGDFDAGSVEAAIRAHFADWAPHDGVPGPEAKAAAAQPLPGPIAYRDHDRTDIYLDPAMAERVTATRRAPWLDEPDTLAQRREDLLRRIGYGIVNRRLQHLARAAHPPFRDAGFGTGDIFKVARGTNLVIDAVSGQWQVGLTAAARVWREAMDEGFTPAEVAEQLAGVREQAEHAAAAADTRPDGALLNAAFELVHDGSVPSPPREDLAELEAFAPQVTPQAVLAALKREAVPLKAPLIRFQGRLAPQGGAAAIRSAWNEAIREPTLAQAATTAGAFAYTDFGAPGAVVADTREPELGIREVRFANGVRLNLKHTDIARDQVLVEMALDGGAMLATRDNPLATEMMPMMSAAGLGKHSQDELQTLLAGHRVGFGLSTAGDTFQSSAQTTPADLALQLELMAALITDPGYRPEGELQYHLAVNNLFLQMRATPASALANAIGGILSDNDPRFTLQPQKAYDALTFAKLRHDLADRLAHGAIEIGIVGDIDEAQAIALVARTLGALPPREADFQPYLQQRLRPFTQDHSPRIIRHSGPADQALVHVTWATRDDSDPVEKQRLNLLDGVEQIELTEGLRETLGKAYSPGASSETSRIWRGYGTFTVSASVDVKDLAATRDAIAHSVAALRNAPVSDDMLLRARMPMLDSFDNALKNNAGWLGLVARAQSQPDRIDRQVKAKARVMAVTPAEIEAEARAYLTDAGAVEVTVLPEGAANVASGTPQPLADVDVRPPTLSGAAARH